MQNDSTNGPSIAAQTVPAKKKNPKRSFWVILGIVGLFVIVIGGIAGGYVIHLSNTSPEFCGTCHIMDFNVDSYLTSNNLDNIHNQANVECKECHDYPVTAEVKSGINFVFGNYLVGSTGELVQVKYDNEMCLKCHISYDHVAESTDNLKRNPHKSHHGELACNTCHVSHGEQIDYCSTCHENGGQTMVGADE